MRSIGMCAVVLSVVSLFGSMAKAQGEGAVVRTYFVTPKPGMGLQYEEAYKRHVSWHRQQKDTWRWDTYVVEAGERVGQFVHVTSGHQWEDFDNPAVTEAADAADYESNAGKYAESASSIFSVYRADISRMSPGSTEPAPLLHAIRFELNPNGNGDFRDGQLRIREASEKTNNPDEWFFIRRISGDETPTYILLFPKKSWAEFGRREDVPTLGRMMERVFSHEEWESMMERFRRAVRRESSYILKYRPDLSYVPQR